MRALVSGIVGGLVGAAVVVGGVTTYNAASTDDAAVDASNVSYADE